MVKLSRIAEDAIASLRYIIIEDDHTQKLHDAIESISRIPPQELKHASKAIAQEINYSNNKSYFYFFSRSNWRKRSLINLDRSPIFKYIFLFHDDGYIREAALEKISEEIASPFFVAAITLRLNDWVSAVRQSAARCAKRVFPITKAATLAQAFMYFYPQTMSWRRWDIERTILDQTISRPDVISALAERIIAEPTAPAIKILAVLLRFPELDSFLYDIAFKSSQPSVRALALRTLMTGQAKWRVGTTRQWIDKSMGQFKIVAAFNHRPITAHYPLVDLCTQGCHDRSAIVRKVALEGVIHSLRGTIAGAAIARPLLADHSQGVRSRAEFVLRDQLL